MPDEVVDTPWGRMLVNTDECIGSTIKAGTVWDGPGFLQVIAREYGRLGEVGTTILDIGAHLGDWTIWLASQGAWRVVAVEPAPLMLNYLKANLDLNKAVCNDRVVILPVAAYNERALLQWATPYDPADSGGAALSGVRAQPLDPEVIVAAPLDEYDWLWGQRVSLIKVDAQGCDFAALQGLYGTIVAHRPIIVFEWETALATAHRHTLAGCISWLNQLGYEVQEWPSHLSNFLARPREFQHTIDGSTGSTI